MERSHERTRPKLDCEPRWGSLFLCRRHFTSSQKMIKGMLEWLNVKARNEGHVPDCSSVLLDVDDVDKEQWLWVHSERLALAYGLIRTPSICHVHIIKNLRICAGSHTAIK